MKFMKLGSKPDAFQVEGNCIRCISSDLETDVIVKIGEVKFFLHKFPLLSKSKRLHKLLSKDSDEILDELDLVDFPGGPKTFEVCTKFCYGMTVTLNPYNVVAARCGAEYLEMTEDVERGNLIFKIEVFLNSSVFGSWKDSIIVLQTTKSLLPWSEDLKVVGRCIDSIASKTSMDPSKITWSYTYNRKVAFSNRITDSVKSFTENKDMVPNDWWVEDICELDIDLYRRVMITVKSKGRMDGSVIGEALKTYAVRWLPDSVDALVSEAHNRRNKSLVETIICLLPSDKRASCSCSFLLKLLKVAILVGADESSREDLMNNISLKLDEATVHDLLIPARSPQTTIYDVALVQHIVNRFVSHENQNRDSHSSEKLGRTNDGFVLGRSSWLLVGKLIDGYLAEIAQDPNITLSSFISLAESTPELARPIHDGLYEAINIYLKEHSGLSKSEKKRLCGLMDVKKLTRDASMHAAQNDKLPLRVVVQVLFFEQLRVSAGVQGMTKKTPDLFYSTESSEPEADKVVPESPRSLQTRLTEMKDEQQQINGKLMKNASKNKGSGPQLLPSRSRRIFDKLWMIGRGNGNCENKSSETSQSPSSMIQGEIKPGAPSRNRRHSIS
ncbi:hypothetical protein LIER_15243 [Lithospermum erythrorhizon]|uniref:BTB/POZ domain-containing protein NPY1 n=1 Tax=Lithospermum erythrorhizon TaxID=34254 RepID=A0AAV3Q419_LITER